MREITEGGERGRVRLVASVSRGRWLQHGAQHGMKTDTESDTHADELTTSQDTKRRKMDRTKFDINSVSRAPLSTLAHVVLCPAAVAVTRRSAPALAG